MKTEHKIFGGLAVLAALAAGLYVTGQNKSKDVAAHATTKASSDLPSVALSKDDVEKITKVEVTNPDRDDKTKQHHVVLEKKGDDWVVTAPVQAKANGPNVKSLIDNLKELKAKEVIDRTTGSYDQYELTDEKGLHVVAWKGGDKAEDLYFGKSGSRGQMVRIAGKDGVYVVSGYASYQYSRELKNWRETSILKFEDDNAIQVEVTNKSGLFSFSKNGDKWSASLTKRDKDGKLEKPEKEWKRFDEAKVKDLLRAYKGLSADDFGEEKDKADSGVQAAEQTGGVVHIRLKDNAADYTIRVGKTSKGSSRWAMKSGDETLYTLASWSSDWATAEPSKFEKPDDKKKDDKKDQKKSEPTLSEEE
jgi:uncharacterized protein (UPF0333 family)